MILRHIPNILTALRLFVIVPFLLFLYQHLFVEAFYLFIFAGFTDGLDGWLARYFNWKSFLGSFIDPLTDKLLIASSFISLALLEVLPRWLVLLVFLRDLTISLGVAAWYLFIQSRLDLKPTWLSKFNTFFQLVLLTVLLYELAFSHLSPIIAETLICLTAMTTAITYLDYVWTWGKKAFNTTTMVR